MDSPVLVRCLICVLLLCNLVIPVIAVIRYSVAFGRVEVNHIFLFTIGYIMYWIIPIIGGVLNYISVIYGVGCDEWCGIFYEISDEKLIIYLILCLLFYMSFISGNIMIQKIKKDSLSVSENKYSYNKIFLLIFLIVGIVLAVIFGNPFWQFFFSGYRKAQAPGSGQFIGAIIFLLTMTIIYATKIHEDSKDAAGFWKIMANPYLFAYSVGAIILVSMGGRIIVMSSIVMFLVFYSNYFRRISLKYFILTLCILVLFSHVIVLWRTVGINGIFILGDSYNKFVRYFFSDSVMVSYSLVQFLKEYTIPVIKFPVVLLSNFINLIPSFLFPAKSMYFITYQDLGIDIDFPTRMMNSFPSLMINFGAVGTAVFLFLFSALLGWLKNQRSVSRAIYILVSGWLPFCFFRGFEVTMIKMILEFSILEPIIVTFLCFLMTKMITQGNEVK